MIITFVTDDVKVPINEKSIEREIDSSFPIIKKCTASVTAGWSYFNTRSDVSCIAADGNYIWVGTKYSGLIKINIKSGKKEFFNHSNSGLPDNRIVGIAPDNTGNVWIACALPGVVAKFTGSSWSIYKILKSTVPAPNISSIAIDHKNTLWLGAYRFKDDPDRPGALKRWFGLIKFDGEKWVTFDSTNSFIRERVNCISVDKNNVKWIAAFGLIKYDEKQWVRCDQTNTGLIRNSDISQIVIDSSGNKWLSARSRIIKYDDSTSKTFYDSITGLTMFDQIGLAIESGNILWISCFEGIAKYNGKKWSSSNHPELKHFNIEQIAVDCSGNKWLGFDNGLWRFDNMKITEYQIIDCPFKCGLSCLTIDSRGNKWIGTDKGLLKYNGQSWVLYDKNNSGLPDNQIRCMVIDNKRNVWIGTNSGLTRFDGKNWYNYNEKNSGLKGRIVRNIAVDGNGIVWVGSYTERYSRTLGGWNQPDLPDHYGITRFDGKRWKNFTTKNSAIPGMNVYCMGIAPDGHLWTGLNEGNGSIGGKHFLSEFDGTTWKNVDISTVFKKAPNPKHLSDFSSNSVRTVTFEKNGSAWIETASGIARYDGTEWAVFDTSIIRANGLKGFGGIEYCMTVDSMGNKWIGTSNELCKYNDSAWTVFSIENSGYPGSAKNIAFDNDGHLWFITSSGLGEFTGNK